jgi:hypothetical protein
MSLVGTGYLVYIASPAFRELAKDFDLDEYGAIYTVTVSSHTPNITKPSRDELDGAHWAMFLVLLGECNPELKVLSEKRGFDACWSVHQLDVESGDDAVSDARSLNR